MIFRQLFDEETSTYTYLLGCERTREAALIDPVLEKVNEYVKLLDELDLKLVYTLETHVHADHVTAGGTLRELVGSSTVVHKDGGAPCADLQISDRVPLRVGDVRIRALHTPGHTEGCTSYHVGDRVFTGDTLLIGGCGRTDFQGGDAGTLYDSITRKLFTLPDETLVFPGHDYKGKTVSTIGLEKERNPRLAGKCRAEFVEIMENLDLAPPKHIDRAVPANQACGLEQTEVQG